MENKGGSNNNTARSGEERALLKVLIYVLPLLFALAFAAFLYLSKRTSAIEIISDSVSVLFFAYLVLCILPKFFVFFSSDDPISAIEKAGERSRRRIRPFFGLIIISLVIQLAFIITAHLLDSAVNSFSGTVFKSYSKLFITSHGIAIGENTRGLISSLGALAPVLPDNLERTVVSLKLVLPLFLFNTATIAAASPLLYELLLLDFDKRSSKFGVWVFLVSPSMLLMLQPMSGASLFFVCTFAAILFARKGKLCLSAVFSALACLFNILGLILIVPLLLEAIKHCIHAGREKSRRHSFAAALTGCIPGVVLPLLLCGASMLFCYYKGVPFKPLETAPVLFFEPLGRLFVAGSEGLINGDIELLFVGLFVSVGVLAVFGVRRLRLSSALYTVLFAATAPAVLGVQLSMYAVMVFPLLPALEAAVLSRKYLRTWYTVFLAILSILFIAFCFVRRSI